MDEEYSLAANRITTELNRVKKWANDNGFHVGTSTYMVVRRYRDELKLLRKSLQMNIEEIK